MRCEASAAMTADGLQGLWRGGCPPCTGPYLGSASTSPQCTGCATPSSTENRTLANPCSSELPPGLLLDLS